MPNYSFKKQFEVDYEEYCTVFMMKASFKKNVMLIMGFSKFVSCHIITGFPVIFNLA